MTFSLHIQKLFSAENVNTKNDDCTIVAWFDEGAVTTKEIIRPGINHFEVAHPPSARDIRGLAEEK